MIDLDILLDDRLAIVGTSGSGKTYAAKGMVETLVANGARVCVVDALGVWWGLRAGADGGRGGLPVLILGGAHADVGLAETDGPTIARAVAAAAVQCVVDLSTLDSGAARRRFMSAFLDALYEANREPLHLVLDEADLWAPQRPRPEGMTLLGRVDEIVRRGRVRGFIPWLITQRPAVLHKDVLSQADVLVAMKLTSSQDRAAIGAWIEGQADRAEEKALLAALPRLPRGEGWVWAPGRGVLEQVAFPPIATFDSSRTPARGDPAVQASLAPLDAAAFRSLLGKGGSDQIATPDRYSEGYEAGRADGYVDGYRDGKAEWLEGTRDSLRPAADAMTSALHDLQAVLAIAAQPTPDKAPAPDRNLANFIKRAQLGTAWTPSTEDAAEPTTCSRSALRILHVLAIRHPAPQSEAQWATLACMARKGGAWNGHRRELEKAGLVAEAGRRWSATPAGLAVAGVDAAAPQSPAETLAAWKRALGPGPSKLLDALLLHPKGLDRAQLAALVRMSPQGGAFNGYLRDLVNNELAAAAGRNRYVAQPALRDDVAMERE